MKAPGFFPMSLKMIMVMMIIPGFISVNYSQTAQNIYLDPVPGYLDGVVISAATGNPVIGAKITVGTSTGYSTGPLGAYSVSILPVGSFSATCTKAGFDNLTAGPFTFTQGGSISQNLSLPENVNPPNNVTATLNGGQTAVNISWNVPGGNYELLYDDGIQEAFQVWPFAGSYNAVKFTTASFPCTLTGGNIHIGSQANYQAGSNPFVPCQFLVFDASGPGGAPGVQVAGPFDFTPISYGWNNFIFSTAVPITSESFYLVRVQGGNSPDAAGIAIDATSGQARSYTRNIPSPDWVNVSGNFMMRALLNGPGGPVPLMMLNSSGGTTSVNTPPDTMDNISMAIGYQVFRLLQGQEGTPGLWNPIASPPVPGTVDNSWPSLPSGPFRWAVKAQFVGNRWSSPTFSNILGKNWTAPVTVNVGLSCAGDSPQYTNVKLVNINYPDTVYQATLGSNGTCTFPQLWLGTYTLTVTKFGYTTHTQTPITIVAGGMTLTVNLLQIKTPPSSLWVNNKSLVATWSPPRLTMPLFTENWNSGSFATNGWVTTGGTNWVVSAAMGNPAPSAIFSSNPQVNFYHQFLTSKDIAGQHSPFLSLKYDMALSNNLTPNTNSLSVEIWNGSTWDILKTYTNAADIPLTSETLDITAYAHLTFKIRFHTYGFNSSDINWWLIDNISIMGKGPDPDPCLLGYNFYIQNNLTAFIPDTTYTIPAAMATYGQTLMCCVRAMYASGLSDLLCTIVTSHYLCPPANLMTTDMGSDAFLSWEKPVGTCGGLIGYKIYRSQGGPGGPWLLIKFIPGENTLNTSDLALSAGEYWYRVVAYYDLASYGYPGSFDESFYTGPEPVYINFIPDNRTMQNKTFTNGMTDCFDATQVITVAGNNTAFSVQNGGSITMIAGQEIHFFPTTTVQPGGYLHGSITTTSAYCGAKGPSLVSIAEREANASSPGNSSFFKVYPNPTTGVFILELDDDCLRRESTVEIYSAMGEKTVMERLSGVKKHLFSLDSRPVGVYYVRVAANGTSGSVKIIKQ